MKLLYSLVFFNGYTYTRIYIYIYIYEYILLINNFPKNKAKRLKKIETKQFDCQTAICLGSYYRESFRDNEIHVYIYVYRFVLEKVLSFFFQYERCQLPTGVRPFFVL